MVILVTVLMVAVLILPEFVGLRAHERKARLRVRAGEYGVIMLVCMLIAVVVRWLSTL